MMAHANITPVVRHSVKAGTALSERATRFQNRCNHCLINYPPHKYFGDQSLV